MDKLRGLFLGFIMGAGFIMVLALVLYVLLSLVARISAATAAEANTGRHEAQIEEQVRGYRPPEVSLPEVNYSSPAGERQHVQSIIKRMRACSSLALALDVDEEELLAMKRACLNKVVKSL